MENDREIKPAASSLPLKESTLIDVHRLQDLLDATDGADRWEHCSIYRVPSHIVKSNEGAYKPRLVSIGPYHHHEAHLKPAEEHKYRALSQFLKRSMKTLEDFKMLMKDVAGRLMDSYEQLEEEWKEGDKFLELMTLDGCFVLEILRVFTFDHSLGYSNRDPVFGDRGRSTIVNNLVEDCLLLENQLPFQVFERLLEVENRSSTDPGVFMDSALSIIGGRLNNTESIPSKLHTVDLLRNKIIGKPHGQHPDRAINWIGIESATTYRKAGIVFARSDTNFLTDIRLENNVLRLPVFELSTMSQTIWLNVLAFERLHAGLTQDISAYICVMARLLRTAEDVNLFLSSGLISVLTYGEVGEILALIKTLRGNVVVEARSNILVEAIEDLHEYYVDHEWRTTNRRDSLCSIYRVPSNVVKLDESAYKPKRVSIGPYHHHEGHLKLAEEHKRRALSRFLKRSEKTLEDFKRSMKDAVGLLMDSYESLSEEWKEGDKFLELMILDGCFLLEILGKYASGPFEGPGHDPDPFFGNLGRSITAEEFVEDCLLLENQLPFQVLTMLLALGNLRSTRLAMPINRMYAWYDPAWYDPESFCLPLLHLVDLQRKIIIGRPGRSSDRSRVITKIGIESATKYKSAGIVFHSSGTNVLTDIMLENKDLWLPVFELSKMSQTMWLNVLAFERRHTGLTKDISAYCYVMARLLRTDEDVKLFRSQGWISESPSAEVSEILAFMKTLRGKVDFHVSSDLFGDIAFLHHRFRRTNKCKRWIRQRTPEWSSNLMQTHFKSPWSVIGVIAGALVLGFTFTQALYAILAYNQKKG